MKLFELIMFLTDRGINIRNEGGKLRVEANEGVLTPAVVQAVKTWKKEVAAYYATIAPAHSDYADTPQPLSFAQQRLFFIYQYDPIATYFNLPLEIALAGTLDQELFERALRRVILRHPILQTTYFIQDGEPRQQCHSQRPCEIATVDLSGYAIEEQEMRLGKLRQSAASTPFQLETELPIRILVIRKSETELLLLLVFHHIAIDEWSIHQLIHEVAQEHRFLRVGRSASRNGEELTYIDFVHWQRERFERGGLAAARSFWKHHLEGAPPFLELPSDHTRPLGQTYGIGFTSRPLPKALREGVSKTARTLGFSEFSFYLGIYNLLLFRLTNQRDFVVGIDVFGRDHPSFKSVVGFFVNQLALRARIPVAAELASYLKEMARDTEMALTFQDMPFEKVVADLKVERDPGYSPLFQVKFAYRRTTWDIDLFEGVRVTNKDTFQIQSQYDLTLQVTPDRVEAYFNPDLFSTARVESWVGWYLMLVETGIEDSRCKVSSLLQPDLRERLLPFTQGILAPTKASELTARIEEQARVAPERIAVVDAVGQTMTYAELWHRAESVARQLMTRGFGRGNRIAVYVQRSTEMVVAVLAVARVGGVLVPLDPANPSERNEYILTDSCAAVLLCEDATVESYFHGFRGVCMELRGLSSIPALGNLPAHDELDSDGEFYLLYTSGSSGRPKGVSVRRAGFSNLCDWYIEFAGIDIEAAVLLMISIGFDASLKNIFSPLMTGAKLVLAPAEFFEPGRLLSQIEKEGVTLVNATPTALYALVAADLPNEFRALNCLRMFAVGGEALKLDSVQPWLNHENCTAELANIYGPTECTDISVAFKASSREWLECHQIPIGRPIRNTRAYIVDDEDALCPPGTTGELVISGVGVAIGYQNLPDVTASKFSESSVLRQLVYRTGDYCRYDELGRIIYRGRRDRQAKIRGVRIELGEIESMLQRCGGVREAAVLLREDTPGDQRLVAYLTARTEGLSIQAVREHVRSAVLERMIPSAYVVLESLPLTPNGKVDCKALPVPELGAYLVLEYEAPQGGAETALAEIWRDVLKVERVGRHDNFFELGGHSLLVQRVLNRLYTATEKRLTFDEFFRAPTIMQQAAKLETEGTLTDDNDQGSMRIEPPIDVPVVPTPMQQEVLDDFLREEVLANNFHVMRFAFIVEGVLSARQLQLSLNVLLKRHDALRSFFKGKNGTYELHVDPAATIEVKTWDTVERADSEKARLFVKDQLEQPFQLESAPLLRVGLLNCSCGNVVLLAAIHHLIIDGWSLGIFWSELAEIYRGTSEKVLSSATNASYLEFAHWQQQFLGSRYAERQNAFWRSTLARLPKSISIPNDYPRPATYTYSGRSHVELLPMDAHIDISRGAIEKSVTSYVLSLAAVMVMLYMVSRQRTLYVLTPVAGRPDVRWEGCVGFFARGVIVRVDLEEDLGVKDVLALVNRAVGQALSNAMVPRQWIEAAAGPKLDASYSARCQVHFTHTVEGEGGDSGLVIGECFLRRMDSESKAVAYGDFGIETVVGQHSSSLVLTYCNDIYSAETVRWMSSCFTVALEWLSTKRDDVRLSRLCSHSSDYRRLLLSSTYQG